MSTHSDSHALTAFVTRLHFYIGLFIGPFLFIAALSGTLYVLTPQIEHHLYAAQLRTDSTGPAQPLALQVQAARAAIGDGPRLFAVRPAPSAGMTTRVMFTQPGLGESESRAVFIDPVTLAVQGEQIVYGTSGILPFRIQLDYLHRNLLLGDWGRNYSELAASWLWVAILGGLILWWQGGIRNRPAVAARSPSLKTRRRHGLIGLWLALGLLFFSATGLTWSKWAGSRIDLLRQQMGWITPAISLTLPSAAMHADHGNHAAHGEHEGHDSHAAPAGTLPQNDHADHGSHGSAPAPAATSSSDTLAAPIDAILATARAHGIDASQLELRPPARDGLAWRVSEMDRSWPTQVDTVAIDPATLQITSRADFATFPLIAKLIRWGIDAHMGVLFGLPNQLLMAAIGIGLMTMIVLGYRLWWRRRPAPGKPGQTLLAAWRALTWPWRLTTLALATVLAWCLPVLGASLLAFAAIDAWRTWRGTPRHSGSHKHPA